MLNFILYSKMFQKHVNVPPVCSMHLSLIKSLHPINSSSRIATDNLYLLEIWIKDSSEVTTSIEFNISAAFLSPSEASPALIQPPPFPAFSRGTQRSRTPRKKQGIVGSDTNRKLNPRPIKLCRKTIPMRRPTLLWAPPQTPLGLPGVPFSREKKTPSCGDGKFASRVQREPPSRARGIMLPVYGEG